MEKILSNTDDFTWGHGNDELLARMGDELNVMNPGHNAIETIAAIKWLDAARDDTQEGDYVLLHPAIAPWVLLEVEILDDEIRAFRDAAVNGDEPDPVQGERFEELAVKPFRVKLADEDYVPVNIRGQEVTIAFMKTAEAETEWGSCLGQSVRADGTLIISNRQVLRRL